MAADMSVDSFLGLLRQSSLVVDSQMLALTAEFGGDGTTWENARAVAAELVKRGILTEWQADNLLQGKHRGFRLGPHRILMPLGKGGMSQVYLAEHIMMRRRCAIKVLPSKYQEDPDLLSRFHLEARAIAALDHPHIVRAYDFNKDVLRGKEIHYLVMEYVEGQDLRRMVEEQGPLDYRKAADFIRQAAEGLAHAHAAGFVHRDVKPANLLVDPNGVLKILDLGLALEGQETWDTSEGQQSAVGTADYVAPEQVMDSRTVDGRADIYSLGYTFYFLLTGRRPFPKSTLVELLMAHRVENPEPISNLRPDVPMELVEIIDRMTSKNPDLRFQTAKDVAERLQTWLHDSENRDYSRISALMAAAMRAKQPGSDSSATKPESAARQTELELTFLDDEPAASADAQNAENQRTAGTRRADSDARDKPRRPSSGDSGRTPALRPGDSGKTAALSRSNADLLLELNAAPTLGTRPQYKHPSNSLLQSPWLWVILAAVICVLFLLLAVLSTVFSTNPPPQRPPKSVATKQGNHSATSPQSTQTPKDGQSESAASSKPATENAKPAPVTPTPPAASPSKEAPPTTPPTPPPQTAPAQTPPAQKPAEKPTETPQPKPPEPPPEKKETPPPVTPPAKPALAESVKLLAGIKNLSIHFADPESQRKGLLELVQRYASDVIKSLRPPIEITADSPNVLEIDLKPASDSESAGLVLTAELRCPAPNGGAIVAWKRSDQVTPRQDNAAIRAFLRLNSREFFKKLTEEIRKSRLKVKLD